MRNAGPERLGVNAMAGDILFVIRLLAMHFGAGKLRPEISGSSPGASPRFLHRRPRSRKQPSATCVGLMTGSPLCLGHVEMPLDGFFY
jgi:hypothetical protein